MTTPTELLQQSMPLCASLGITADEAAPSRVVLTLAWDERWCTSGGLLHGGALMALADCTGGFCAFLNLPEGAGGTATIESKTNFFRPVRDRWVEARSRPLHRGRTTIVVETDLYDADEKHVARVTQTQAVL